MECREFDTATPLSYIRCGAARCEACLFFASDGSDGRSDAYVDLKPTPDTRVFPSFDTMESSGGGRVLRRLRCTLGDDVGIERATVREFVEFACEMCDATRRGRLVEHREAGGPRSLLLLLLIPLPGFATAFRVAPFVASNGINVLQRIYFIYFTWDPTAGIELSDRLLLNPRTTGPAVVRLIKRNKIARFGSRGMRHDILVREPVSCRHPAKFRNSRADDGNARGGE